MIQLGIFGAGRIGKIHADNVKSDGRASLKYIVDPHQPSADFLANRHAAQVVSMQQALEDSDIQGIIIAGPTDTHAAAIEAAAKAGKAIFCEKPIDLDLPRVDAAWQVVKDAGVPLLLGFNRRFDPTLGGVGVAVQNGDVGNLELLSITSRDPEPPPVEYIAHSGGLFLDMMIHDFDMAHWILGEIPVEVYARGSALVDPAIGDAGDIDTAVVTLTTASGKLCQISNSRRAIYGYDQRIEAFGSKGMVQAHNLRPTQLQSWTNSGVVSAKPLYFFLERYTEAYLREMTHFLDCIEGKATPLVGMAEGRVALTLGLAAKESLQTGKPVRLNP